MCPEQQSQETEYRQMVEGSPLPPPPLKYTGEKLPSLSAFMPAYNEEPNIRWVTEDALIKLRMVTDDLELIIVNDGSADKTGEIIDKLAQEYPGLVVVSLSRNFGQHYALTAGLDLASGEWTVVMDCDLQDLPEVIPRLIAEGEKGYDVVVARRLHRKHKRWKRPAKR